MAAQPRYPEVLREPRTYEKDRDSFGGLDIPIDLAGVPTIPDVARKFLCDQHGKAIKALPHGLAKRTNNLIRKACAEIQRRRHAAIPAYVPAEDFDIDD